MSANLPDHYVRQFSTNVNMLVQQKGSRLRGAVMSGSHVGSQASPVDQIAPVTAQKVTSRFAPMGRQDATLDRRWVFPVDYDLPQLVDKFDKLRLITDPESNYVTNAVYAMGRAQDDEILAAFTATAKTGVAGGTSTSILSGNTVSVDTGGTASGMNFKKLREAKRLLMSHDIDPEDPLFCVVAAKEHDALLNEIQVISSDFQGNDQPVLKEGKVTRVLGINLIHSERVLTATDDQSGSSHSIPVWAKSGMYFGEWDSINASVSQRNDLQGEPWQAYVKGTFGATRLEEKKIIRVWCR